MAQYTQALNKQMEEERKAQEKRDYERRKSDLEKKKQLYFKQKEHIAFLSQNAPKETKEKPETAPKMSRSDKLNSEKKHVEVRKNTERMLTSIYKDIFPIKAKKEDSGVKKPKNSLMRPPTSVITLQKKESNENFQTSDDNKGFNDLYKMFAKDTGFN